MCTQSIKSKYLHLKTPFLSARRHLVVFVKYELMMNMDLRCSGSETERCYQL